MSVEKCRGIPTYGIYTGWETTYKKNNWKIQCHKKFFFRAGLKSYRLLDSRDCLRALADTEEETRKYLDQIIKH